jgi:CRISPR system Cascade subunit CasB
MGNLPEALMKFLKKRKDDRGTIANLRCGLVESKRHRAWPLLAWCNGIGNDYRALTIQHFAGFFATHPEDDPATGNFGGTCRQLMDSDELDRIALTAEVGPLSRRFQHLIAADGEEIFPRVLRFVLRCKAKNISINYMQLFNDLKQWEYSPEAVRTRWAKSFWASETEDIV